MSKAVHTELEYVELDERDQQELHLEIGYKKINCGFIYGTVKCGNTGKHLPKAIVKAINVKTNKSYFAMTNKFGFYALCVPPGNYLVFACLPQC